MMADLAPGVGGRELVAGDPDELDRLATRLSELADGMLQAAAALTDVEVAGWRGLAADAFSALVGDQPATYRRAGSAFADAAAAISAFAAVLRRAQEDAARAAATFEDATRSSADWHRAHAVHDAEVRSAQAAGRPVPNDPPPPAVDPGAAERALSQQLLGDARSAVRAQGHVAASALSAAAALAPKEPGLLDSIVSGARDLVEGAEHGLEAVFKATSAVLEDAGGWIVDRFEQIADGVLDEARGLLAEPFGRGARRHDGRTRNDDRLGIPPGARARERSRGGDFESDWAGRELLQRYLDGGDDLTIRDDPDWNRYMMANPLLTAKLRGIVERKAVLAYQDFTGPQHVGERSFDDSGPLEIQNGEGISGYQYLHGTNEEVGGFNFRGSTHVTRVAGGYEVRIPATYTWNDRIDPNGTYITDRVKSTVAEVFTLGRADGYDLHLSWSAETTVRLDEAGNVIEVRGYPGR